MQKSMQNSNTISYRKVMGFEFRHFFKGLEKSSSVIIPKFGGQFNFYHRTVRVMSHSLMHKFIFFHFQGMEGGLTFHHNYATGEGEVFHQEIIHTVQNNLISREPQKNGR